MDSLLNKNSTGSSSVKSLKQSGLSDPQSPKIKTQPQRYPTQYDESSVRTDITEADIATYVRRIADKAVERNVDYNYCQGRLCDNDLTVEDCPQNECYRKYLDPNYAVEDKLDPSKRVFFDNLRDIITSQPAAYQDEPESYMLVKSRIEELLQNKQPKCDFNLIETPLLENMTNNGVCSKNTPNACDRPMPNIDCGNRECYKKYLMDDLTPVVKDSTKDNSEKKNQMMRVKFNDTEKFLPVASANASERAATQPQTDFRKKYNTLVVNSDISVPEFIDVLVVMSEKPIKITLPHLQGPTLASAVGSVVAASNLLIKNLSLVPHQIVTNGSNRIDTVRTSISIESGGKKTLGAVHDSWILL